MQQDENDIQEKVKEERGVRALRAINKIRRSVVNGLRTEESLRPYDELGFSAASKESDELLLLLPLVEPGDGGEVNVLVTTLLVGVVVVLDVVVNVTSVESGPLLLTLTLRIRLTGEVVVGEALLGPDAASLDEIDFESDEHSS